MAIRAAPQRRRRGLVHVEKEMCKGCGLCVAVCPVKILRLSREVNSMGYNYAEVKPGEESKCIACRLCEWYCPDLAIWIEEV